MKIDQYYDRAISPLIKQNGVYLIYHTQYPGRVYIGSASGTANISGFRYRWNKHITPLQSDSHCNAKLQNMVNKYGLDGLRFEIIEICDPSECLIREQYWMDKLNPYYNIAKFAGNTLGVKPTTEQIMKRTKRVSQYGLDGEYINTYPYSSIASEVTGTFHGDISKCCRTKAGSAGGFQWRHGTYEGNIGTYYNATSIRILCYDLNGKFKREFLSTLEASNVLNIPAGNISKNINGLAKSVYGHIFVKYHENYSEELNIKLKHKFQKEIKITNLRSGEIFIFESMRKANAGGFDRNGLRTALKSANGIMVNKKIKVELI